MLTNDPRIPAGMSRRHWLKHIAMTSMAIPAMQFTRALQANAAHLQKQGKSCILLWMGGGPATIDIWDLKPGAETGGEFRQIQFEFTNAVDLADMEIHGFTAQIEPGAVSGE